MKQVLSLLVAFTFLQVQSWALSGGPVYPSNSTGVSGTYGGTLTGEVSFDAGGNPANPGGNQLTSNGTGVFLIGVPTAGMGSGVFAFFAGGITYTGAMLGLVDPGELKMTGILKGQAFSVSTQTTIVLGIPTTSTVTVINGFLGAVLTANLVTDQGGANSGLNGVRLEGTAVATSADKNNAIIGSSTLIVDGFLQSSTVTGTVDLSTLTNTSTPNSGGN
jgi:hypothetical protein